MAAENLEAGTPLAFADGNGSAEYGAMQERFGAKRKAPRKPADIRVVVGCLVVPLLIFDATYWLMGFWLRYNIGWLAWVLSFVVFLLCPLFAYMAIRSTMDEGLSVKAKWLWWLTLLSTACWIAAMVLGNNTYQSASLPYNELYQLNYYESVDPSRSIANQYMDFGIMSFTPDSFIDRTFSMGFQNDNLYCVAPIRQFNQTAPRTFDFWAVGMNCCSKHLKNFMCGMWNSADAHSGVRVMDEAEKGYYQLAVKQASAAYGITADHPVFMYWVQNPTAQILGYSADAIGEFEMSTFFTFVILMAAVAVAGYFFYK